ncbi:MAG: coproporphyrinogen III oxidase, partial [Myxococcota bacterium]
RLSLGVQDFDPRVQLAIHRVQTVAQVQAVTDAARELGYTSVGYDLVYGLPHQTLPSIEATIASVMRLGPDRIAFYGYAHVPWVKKAQRGFTEEDLPTPPERRALYERGRDMLVAAGYREIGMDHFAKADDALAVAQDQGTLHRNFMGYTPRRVEPLIGLGVSAIGDAGTCFAQNDKDVDGYQAKVAVGELPIVRGHLLDAEDLVIRHHVLQLMTRFETSWEEGGPAWTPFLASVAERLAPMIDDGLVVVEPGSCRVTESGQAFVRNVCMAFDARLVRRAPTTSPTFSRTV